MSKTLAEIAQQLRDVNKKVQLIYAFNGVGKTRLSRAFKDLIAPKNNLPEGEGDNAWLSREKILYYNAFTEDLFYWDNDLELDVAPKLKIQPNSFTDWVLEVLKVLGQDRNIAANFQRYTDEKLTPRFNEEYKVRDADEERTVKAFSEVTFSYERGDEQRSDNLKISKGEESNFIWSVFYTLLEQVVVVRNVADPEDRETDQFDGLEYVFVDDPVSSLDENHLIELAVDLSQLIRSSDSGIRFILTTHNPLFYNVLHHELKNSVKYQMKRLVDGTYELIDQPKDSPFSYHLFLKAEIEKAIESGQLSKYHFNFLRNILEKMATFLGYREWGDLLPKSDDDRPNPYHARIVNISSHSKHAGEEVADLTEDDKRVLSYLVRELNEMYRFQKIEATEEAEG